MSAKVGLGLALDGEKEFRQGIKNVNLELKLLDNQTKMVSLRYAENENSVEALTEKNRILNKQLEQQQKKLTLTREQMEVWQETNRNAGLKVEELKNKLQEAEAGMEDMKKSSGATEEELQKQQKTIDGLSRELRAAEEAYKKSDNKINQYKVSVSSAEVGLTKLDEELRRNEKYLDEAQKSSNGLATSIDKYGKKVEEAKDETSSFGDILKANLASEAIINGVEKIAEGVERVASTAVKTGSEFEKSMSQVAATMGLTAKQIEQGSEEYRILEKAAEESGKTTKYTASQAAEALNYLALAGYDARKAAQTLPSVLTLAAAGGLELSYASDLVTDSMAALGMETDRLDNYIDQLAKTSQKSNTSVSQLGEASLVAAGTASMTGQSVETLNTELGILANRGIKGAEGGTHLRNILLRLVQPTQDGAAALKSMNVEVTDSTGSVRDLNDIMNDLNRALSSMSEYDKTNAIGTIFNKTDIGAVNALLSGTGDEFNNLRKELLTCDGAAADMAETMEANLSGKATILQSALEGLGITAYKRIEGTLKNSVDSATGAVGRLQASMDNGKLGNAVDSFSEALGNAADHAIDFAEDALPLLINGLTWVLDNSDVITAGIAGVTAAGIEMKVIAPAVQSVTAAWNAYKTANEGATVSQWLLNTAMNANPVAIIITALVGLTAAVAAYTTVTDNAANRVKKFREENEQLVEQQKNQTENRKQEFQAIISQTAAVDGLAAELTALNEKEKLSAQDKSRIKQIVDQLNQALPELNLTINEQTGYLNQNTEAVQKYIAKSKEMYLLAAAEEDLAQNAKEQYEANKELADAREELKEVTEQLEEAEARYNKAVEDGKDNVYGGITLGEYGELKGEMKELSEKKEILINTINEEEAHLKTLGEDYEEVEEMARGYSQGINEVSDSLEKAGEVQIAYNGNVYTVSQQVAENINMIEQAYADAKAEALESINQQVGLFDELSVKSELSVSEMAAHLKSQTEAFSLYSENMTQAAQIIKEDTTGNFAEIVEQISGLGMAGAGYLNELVNAYYDNRQQFDDLLGEWSAAESAKQVLADTTAAMQTDYEASMNKLTGTQGETWKQMVMDGKTITPNWINVYKEAGDEATDNASSSMETMGKEVKEGGQNVTKEAVKTTQNTIDGVTNELKTVNGKSLEFEKLGASVAFGMATGIKDNELEAVKAAETMANRLYMAAKNELEVNSPSKKFEYLAEMSVEGYRNRLMSQMGEVMTELDSLIHPERPEAVVIRREDSGELTHLTRLLEEYLPECAAAKTIIPTNQLSREMSQSIDKNLNINAVRKGRFN